MNTDNKYGYTILEILEQYVNQITIKSITIQIKESALEHIIERVVQWTSRIPNKCSNKTICDKSQREVTQHRILPSADNIDRFLCHAPWVCATLTRH